MADSARERVIAAVKAGMTELFPNAEVKRNASLPERAEPGGLIIIRDGDPGSPDVTLGQLTYTYTHPVPIEIVTPAGVADREAVLDQMLIKIGVWVESNRTLGGLTEWLEPSTPDTDDIQVGSSQPARWAGLDVIAVYSTPNPLT